MYQSHLNLAALNHLSDYQNIKEASSEFEAKGIFHSELLMVKVLIELIGVEHVIESGRARGQSTEVIARICDAIGIKFDSIEFDDKSPDVQIAEERLKSFKHVCSLHYGDSFEIMPRLIPKDKKTLLIVDGPKGVWGLKLGLSMMQTGNVAAVLFHDTHRDAIDVRPILEKYFKKNLIVSDDYEYVELFRHLDYDCWDVTKSYTNGQYGPYKRGEKKMRSYAGTLSCVIYDEKEKTDLNNCLDELEKLTKRKGSFVFKAINKLKIPTFLRFINDYIS